MENNKELNPPYILEKHSAASIYKDALIHAQEEYIKFLTKELNNASIFLHQHSIDTPGDVVELGTQHRKRIREYKEKLNDYITKTR